MNNAQITTSAKVAWTRNLPTAMVPTRATVGSAAYDLYAAAIEFDESHQRLIIDIGISTSFDSNHVMLIFGRSGLALRYGLRLTNSVGVIDSDYRGPIKVILKSDFGLSMEELIKTVSVGDRVAQAIFIPISMAHFFQVPVGELEDSARGTGGFGSTGS